MMAALKPILRNSLELFQFRKPQTEDGVKIFNLAKTCKELDVNSLYFYLLFGNKFSETSVVVFVESHLTGFLVAFQTPDQPETLFIWQIAVSGEYRGMGLGKKMLDHLIGRELPGPVRFLEATVTPSNFLSQELFRSWAKEQNWQCREEAFFGKELFVGENHEPEILFRIGPLTRSGKGL